MADLAHVLRSLPPRTDPSLLVGSDIGDDAAIYRFGDDLALVQTVDFFTPIVDDPYTFGQIAAANSLSDVYAVGGRPITAMNIVGFPVKSLPVEILSEILRGGADKAAEAGVTIVGGHTIDDEEPKYGLSVAGTVHPDRYISGKGALAGDLLILTKPLGTGLVTTAHKAGKAHPDHVRQAIRWMSMLNRNASRAMVMAEAHAATDVTGFGLLGHLHELCKASGVGAVLETARVPTLPGAFTYARENHVPAGTWTNLGAVGESMVFDPKVDEVARRLLADPQTSGGLLVSIVPSDLQRFRGSLGTAALSSVIGHIADGEPGTIHVRG